MNWLTYIDWFALCVNAGAFSFLIFLGWRREREVGELQIALYRAELKLEFERKRRLILKRQEELEAKTGVPYS